MTRILLAPRTQVPLAVAVCLTSVAGFAMDRFGVGELSPRVALATMIAVAAASVAAGRLVFVRAPSTAVAYARAVRWPIALALGAGSVTAIAMSVAKPGAQWSFAGLHDAEAFFAAAFACLGLGAVGSLALTSLVWIFEHDAGAVAGGSSAARDAAAHRFAAVAWVVACCALGATWQILAMTATAGAAVVNAILALPRSRTAPLRSTGPYR